MPDPGQNVKAAGRIVSLCSVMSQAAALCCDCSAVTARARLHLSPSRRAKQAVRCHPLAKV